MILILIFLVFFNFQLYSDWGFYYSDRSWIGINFNGSITNYRLFHEGNVSGTGYFHNSNLGTFTSPSQTFEIDYWDIKTYKNGSSDVTQAELYYRIYEQYTTPGSFTLVTGAWLEDLGGGNQKWGKSSSTSLDITSLAPNKTYVLELYIRVYGTSPNEWKYDSNSGNNFKATFNTDAAFPSELSSFTVYTLSKNIVLRWTTSTEINNYGFEIQRQVILRQAQDDSWEKVGFVPGNGNSNSPKDYSFIDNTITNSGKYAYRLKQINNDGSFEYSNAIEIDFTLVDKFSLEQNYPNPFNPSTVISYQIPVNSYVTLKLYDILGNEIATLVDGYKEAGRYEIEFNVGQTISLSPGLSSLSSGVYFYKLQAGDFIQTKKMLLTK